MDKNNTSESKSGIKSNILSLFSESILSTTKFNMLNIAILVAFIAPITLIALDGNAILKEIESIYACNPYLRQPESSTEKITTTCHQNTKIHPTDIINGIDVSHYQGKINWSKMAKTNHVFVITKATGGIDYVDPTFKTNWYHIRKHNLVRGSYHFFYADDDAETQAQHYLATVGRIKSTDLPPILDIEITDHTNKEILIEKAITWLETVEKATNRRPIIYTDTAFGQDFLSDPRFGSYYLWIAQYSKKVDTLPAPWKDKNWFIWQHSQSGQVSGIEGDVDLSRYKGSLDNLHAFIKKSNL